MSASDMHNLIATMIASESRDERQQCGNQLGALVKQRNYDYAKALRDLCSTFGGFKLSAQDEENWRRTANYVWCEQHAQKHGSYS